MSLRRNGLLLVPVMLGCWTLKPADEVPDAGLLDAPSDLTRGEVEAVDLGGTDLGADAPPIDAGTDASTTDVAPDIGMDAPRVDAGTDVVRVDAGTLDAGADVSRVDVVDAPTPTDVPTTFPGDLRLIAPAGLSTVSDRQPTLVWSGAVSGLQLRVCRDRACSAIAYAASVSGTRHEVTSPLPAGVYFWNLRRSDSGRTITNTWQLRVPNVSGRRAGAPVGVSHRDMDGDGFADIAISAPRSFGATTWGTIQVHFGGETISANPGLTRAAPNSMGGLGYGWRLGWGDFNGDNLADLAVGIFDAMRNPEGRIETLRSDRRGFNPGPIISGASTILQFYFPTAIATGDVNGDGYDDLVAGLAGGLGQVQMHLGSAEGLNSLPTVVLLNPIARASAFGGEVAVAGDVDGDGYGDLLVGDVCDPGVGLADPVVCQPTARGRIHIFFGREIWSPLDPPRVTIEGDMSGRLLGAPWRLRVT
ncbi:MAG: FG-GAP and VCBS repeat-containing protein [Polyangiales bacterium]